MAKKQASGDEHEPNSIGEFLSAIEALRKESFGHAIDARDAAQRCSDAQIRMSAMLTKFRWFLLENNRREK